MAASDPVPGVPTPTGTLQGAAAFSWDGATWQPAGAAYSSVATPTGVLRGVAPFSWSGSAWTPTGRSMPGVPTPTGTLDGVAVYTWSGSAWTPAGGAPDVPTPSGTLQGVAAFYWDGAAWQPSGQAGPEIATPSGVLQGMAMFSRSGTTWVPTVSPGTLDLNFITMTTLDPSITLTRASTATYFDANGVMQTAATNVARLDHDPVTRASRGLLIEDASTNLLLNSATLGTQSVATTAQAYTLSFYGTGSVTLSGTSSGTINGTGASNRVVSTFTPTAGTLTLTVSGSVANSQLEALSFATSYIPTTGATATRAVDVATMPVGGWFSATAGTWQAELVYEGSTAVNSRVIAQSAAHTSPLFIAAGLVIGTYDQVGIVETVNALTALTVAKMASTWAANVGTICLNGGAVASGAQTGGFSSLTTIQLMGEVPGGDPTTYGWLRRVRYWPRALSTAELQQVTT